MLYIYLNGNGFPFIIQSKWNVSEHRKKERKTRKCLWPEFSIMRNELPFCNGKPNHQGTFRVRVLIRHASATESIRIQAPQQLRKFLKSEAVHRKARGQKIVMKTKVTSSSHDKKGKYICLFLSLLSSSWRVYPHLIHELFGSMNLNSKMCYSCCQPLNQDEVKTKTLSGVWKTNKKNN